MRGVNLTGTSVFRPRARLIRLLGAELISDEAMAVGELVKNAYDADAETVTVSLRGLLDGEGGVIEIRDDGSGMTVEVLSDAWFQPATTSKRPGGRKRRTPRGRYPLGEKGVGRFAADKLGARLELVSCADGESREVRTWLSWDAFEDEDYLEDVKVQWQRRDPEVFLGTAHGTLLRITELRTRWDAALVERIHSSLGSLVSPTSRTGEFRMILDCPEFPQFDGPIERRLLQAAPYHLAGSVDTRGRLVRDDRAEPVDLRAVAVPAFSGEGGLRVPECGPFAVSLSVWDVDALGDGPARVSRPHRALLKRMNGVSLYRDGFRVAPYGERDNDWLELGQRRGQDPSRRIAPNQIIGTVEITQEGNSQLRDLTNREGLIDTPAFHDLKVLVLAALAVLEDERFARRREAAPPPPPPDADPVLTYLERARGEGTRQASIQAAMSAYTKVRDEAQRREEILLRLAGTGAAARLVMGQLSAVVSSLNRVLPPLDRGHRSVEAHWAAQQVDQIGFQLDALEQILMGGDSGVAPFDLRAAAQDALMTFAPALAALDVNATFEGEGSVLASGQRGAVLQALLHLVENAVLAIGSQPGGGRALSVLVSADPPSVVIRHNGVPVPDDVRGRVFEPFVTTRPGRHGLGLHFVQELVQRSGGMIAVADDGVSFQLRLPDGKSTLPRNGWEPGADGALELAPVASSHNGVR